MIKSLLGIAALLLVSPGAAAHYAECKDKPVPDNVKLACCGKADHHYLPEGAAVETDDGGYTVIYDGHTFAIPKDRVMPADDGCWHIFYSDGLLDQTGQPRVWCFQVPLGL